ncbi:MAG: translation initiation factor IF-2 [Oscillospiraceae bacterium]|nr:translation initiation factor IF-2 [Oscillospiraceae bacterium]
MSNKDRNILRALEGILRAQETIRSGTSICVEAGLALLRGYHERLPLATARRLTELAPEVLAAIPHAISGWGTEEERRCLAASAASDAAMAQVRRAVDAYRERLGMATLEEGGGTWDERA